MDNGQRNGRLRAVPAGKGIHAARATAEAIAEDGREVVIEIRDDLRPEVARLCLLIGEFQTLMLTKREELRTLLKHGHGVDIAVGGDWRVDSESGVLARAPRQTPPQMAFAPAQPAPAAEPASPTEA